MPTMRFFMATLMACSMSLAQASSTAASTDPKPPNTAYEPIRGQAGKDVIWIPTPEGLIDKMLAAAKVTEQDRLFDLGSGDGIIAITAARKFGAQSVGIEYNPDMAQFARRKVNEAGLNNKVRIITGDIFKEDFTSATVVTLYLMPHLNLQLRPTLLKMKPGTRVVSHAFTMGDWEPDETMQHEYSRAYYWMVPAQVAGDWVITGLEGGPVRLRMNQTFQHIGGTMTRGGVTQALMGAKLQGEELKFRFSTPDQTVHTFTGKVEGKRMTGSVSSGFTNASIEGVRQ